MKDYIDSFVFSIFFHKTNKTKNIELFIDSFDEDMIVVKELYEAERVFDETVTIVAKNNKSKIECSYEIHEPVFIKFIYVDVIGGLVYF